VASVGIGLHEEFLGYKLGGAVKINGAYRLVCTDGHYTLNTVVQRRVNDVLPAVDVRMDGLYGVVFTSRYLLEGRSVHHDVYASHCPPQTIYVSHIADEITHGRVSRVWEALTHFVLFQLIAAKNDEPSGAVLGQQHLYELLPERSGAAGYEHM
jgi:hypothetical protein